MNSQFHKIVRGETLQTSIAHALDIVRRNAVNLHLDVSIDGKVFVPEGLRLLNVFTGYVHHGHGEELVLGEVAKAQSTHSLGKLCIRRELKLAPAFAPIEGTVEGKRASFAPQLEVRARVIALGDGGA